MVRDLLPLYHDGICSDSSKKIVEEHIEECAECKKILENLENENVDEKIIDLKNEVLGKHEKKERRKTFTIGIATACVLLVPVLVCLICNLAIGHGLDWFFIVLTALMMVASVSVVPLVVSENRLNWSLGCFTVSLLLLFMVCCIYMKCNWFFIASSGSILGISLIFGPYILSHTNLPKVMRNKKGMLLMLWDTLFVYLIIISCGVVTPNVREYFQVSLPVTTVSILICWICFAIIRYLRANGYVKAGIIAIVVGVFSAFVNNILAVVSGLPYAPTSAEIISRVLSLVIVVAAGLILVVIGMRKSKKLNEKE